MLNGLADLDKGVVFSILRGVSLPQVCQLKALLQRDILVLAPYLRADFNRAPCAERDWAKVVQLRNKILSLQETIQTHPENIQELEVSKTLEKKLRLRHHIISFFFFQLSRYLQRPDITPAALQQGSRMNPYISPSRTYFPYLQSEFLKRIRILYIKHAASARGDCSPSLLKDRELDYQAFNACGDTIKSLNLAGSVFQDLPRELKLPKLEILDLTSSKVRSIPKNLDQLPCLRVLDLAGSSISSLPRGFSSLSLEELSVRHTGIKVFPRNLNLPRLRVLSISREQAIGFFPANMNLPTNLRIFGLC